ncbi:unannotated protein [freshwater metagenome]|uniref:Unannotated protein n=1 Tax=freshwater metagenome TaxID=449393 RepID=A0A6J7ISJ9_9ZZZZ
MTSAGTVIEVRRGETTRYASVLHRADGVGVLLDGGSWNRIGGSPGRVPHDVAHFVVERALGLERGLWGVLAAGGIVQNATFAGGRRPPHALRRATALTEAAGEDLRRAEVLVRAVADLTLAPGPPTARALADAAGERWSLPSATTEAVVEACADLRRHARAWESLDPGQPLVLTWPAAAGRPADRASVSPRRSRAGRRARTRGS